MGKIEIFGNEKLLSFFKTAFSNNKLAHAYIIEGGFGSGKHTLARYLACLFACNGGTSGPCFACESCRKISDGISPDVIEIGLQGDKKYISAEQVREMRNDVFLKPNEENVKTYIISDAHLMNAQAQNILLKVLEEPPQGVYFLLLCENSSNILPTVKSRAPVLKMEIFSDKVLENYLLETFPKSVSLKTANKEEFDLILKIASGRIGEAIRLISDTSANKSGSVYKKAKDFLCLCGGNSSSTDFLTFVKGMADTREKYQDILNFVIFGLRDILTVKKTDGENIDLLFYNDYNEALEVASNFTESGVVKVYSEISTLIQDSYSNANLNNLLNYTSVKIKEKSNG